jgi:hypothetical protein
MNAIQKLLANAQQQQQQQEVASPWWDLEQIKAALLAQLADPSNWASSSDEAREITEMLLPEFKALQELDATLRQNDPYDADLGNGKLGIYLNNFVITKDEGSYFLDVEIPQGQLRFSLHDFLVIYEVRLVSGLLWSGDKERTRVAFPVGQFGVDLGGEVTTDPYGKTFYS